jgi:hypothetical protein
MGNYIDDANRHIEEERQIIRARKQKEQAAIEKKKRAEQVHRDREKRSNSLLW